MIGDERDPYDRPNAPKGSLPATTQGPLPPGSQGTAWRNPFSPLNPSYSPPPPAAPPPGSSSKPAGWYLDERINHYDQRKGPVVDYANADEARGLGMSSRGSQADALAMYRAAALGQGPSAAQAQLQAGLDAANRQQMSMAASARGGGLARSAAMRGAMANAGDQGLAAAQQAAILRAQEQQAGMQGFAGLGSAMRGMDMTQQGMDAEQALGKSRLDLDARTGNDNVVLGLEGLKNQYWNQGEGHKLGWGNIDVAKEQNKIAKNKMGMDQDNKVSGAVMSGVGTALSMLPLLFSDEKLKKDIEPADKDVDQFLDGLRPSKYRYKSEAHGKGEHVSVMAQELEKSPIGKRMVVETKEGKAVDYGKGLPAMVASLARLNARVKQLEAAPEPLGLRGRAAK